MSVIDLDKLINVDNAKEVKFGDKTVSIVFNDDFEKRVTQASVSINQIIDKYSTDDYQDYLDGMSKAQQKKEIDKFMSGLHDEVVGVIDDLLGNGIGEEMYKQYNNSTNAIAAVISVLHDEADKAVKTQENQNRAQRRAKYKKER